MVTNKYYILFFVTLLIFTGCSRKAEKKSKENDTKQKIEIILSKGAIQQVKLSTKELQPIPLSGFITIPAKVLANQDNEALVGSLVSGRVYKVFVQAGQSVNAGQVIMQIEAFAIGEIKASFIKTKAHLDFTKSNMERLKLLYDKQVGAQKTYLEAQAEYQKALAEFDAEDKKIHAIGLSDADILAEGTIPNNTHSTALLNIKAPIGGVIVERNVVVGQMVDVSFNAFRIINTSSVWVDGQIYEKDLEYITANNAVEFVSSADSTKRYAGTISFIGQVVDEHTRTISIRVLLNNNGNTLRPQSFGELHIKSSEGSKGLVLPTTAIVRINEEDIVFVRLNDTTFQKRKVLLGARQSNGVLALEGVQSGDLIVTEGAFYLKSEMLKSQFGEEE